MKTFLPIRIIWFIFLLLVLPQGIFAYAEKDDVVQVETIVELRSSEADGETVYELTGEAILIYQQSFRNKKWIQDETAGVEIDDPAGVITTKYGLGDGITGIKGTLNIHRNNYQFTPVEDPGDPTSTGNEMTYVERTLDELGPDDQGRLVMIRDVLFHEDYHEDSFSTGVNYNVSDPVEEGTFRTEFFEADYIGAAIPVEAIDIIGVAHMFFENVQFTARSLADMGITEMPNVAALRNQEPDGQTVYTLSNEVILTYQESWRNSKYIQDETAGVLIDDPGGVITTTYDVYDGIEGISGTLSVFGNMLQFSPAEDPGPAASSGNEVEPVVVSIEEFNDNFMKYQARLVTLEDVHFVDPDGNFTGGRVYDISDGEETARFRATFYGVDYIGDPVPTGLFHITGLPNSRADGNYITARNWADFEALNFFDITFNIIDESDNEVEDAVITILGEEMPAGQYTIEEVPEGFHSYSINKYGFFEEKGQIALTQDTVITVVMVAIDPDMVTEFPWNEGFEGDFPPQGWNSYSLGEAGHWEQDGSSALHDWTETGMADSWFVSPQVKLPEDDIMLFEFIERKQYMSFYDYSGIWISKGSGNPEHGAFVELYESDQPATGSSEKSIYLNDYAGEVVYIAFVYRGEYAHRWIIDMAGVEFAPEAIEVPDLATLREQEVGDLIYRVTGEVVLTHQNGNRNQKYFQDETGAILVDDEDGIITSVYDEYDAITGLTGRLTVYNEMLQLVPSEDPGEAVSTGNTVEPVELSISELSTEYQAMLVVVREVSIEIPADHTDFRSSFSYTITDDTGEGLLRTPNQAAGLDYFGTPIPETPKDITGVINQFRNDSQLMPRWLADFADPVTSVTDIYDLELRLYPNPTDSRFYIETGGEEIDLVRVFGINGQVVKEVAGMGDSRLEISVTGIQSGMYIVQVVSGNNVRTSKLQISR